MLIGMDVISIGDFAVKNYGQRDDVLVSLAIGGAPQDFVAQAEGDEAE